MAVVGWVDETWIEQEWADAPTDPTVLTSYLQSAYEQCLAYLPHVPDILGIPQPVVPTPVPARFRMAQLMQARALFKSNLAGSGDQIGADGLAVTVYPMDWTVKNLLRPRRVGRVL